ncbi:MAG: DUF3604 domain-containing protein [Planctomycetota bacterium]|jgi:hypothetical protein
MSLTRLDNEKIRCSFVTKYNIELSWQPEKDYSAGTEVELKCGIFRSFMLWTIIEAEVEEGEISYKFKSKPSLIERFQNRERRFLAVTFKNGVSKESSYKINLTMLPSNYAGVNLDLELWVNEGGDPVKENNSECIVELHPGPVEHFSVYARPFPGKDGKVRTALVPEDRFGNPAEFDNAVKVTCSWQGKEWFEEVKKPVVIFPDAPESIGRLTVEIPMQQLSLNENIRNGEFRGSDISVTGNPVWNEKIDNLRPVFGEFHWHTDFSGDGRRPMRTALEYARDNLNSDFTAPGDHNPPPEKWSEMVTLLEEFNDPGEFATIFGWENGGLHGHENYYFTDPDHPMVCGGSAGVERGGTKAENREKAAKQKDFIGIPHHTNTSSSVRKEDDSPYWFEYDWQEKYDYLRLIEIFQVRGNQERNNYSDAWRGWEGCGSSVQDALDKGFKLGFTGGTDNHMGFPGRAFEKEQNPGTNPSKSMILTGVWTEENERQTVYDSMYRRHTWAVWDTRALVVFKINDALSGSNLSVNKCENITASIKLSAQSPLQSLEIVSNKGKVVWSGSADELDIELSIELGEAENDRYYYLRALERSGGLIYASPVFVSVK